MNATVFLVDTLFNLYLMVVILRLWLQMVQADFYNPLSQFVVKATHLLWGRCAASFLQSAGLTLHLCTCR